MSINLEKFKEVIVMPRIPRMLVTDQPAVYHVISRTALDGLPISDTDKEVFLKLLKFLGSVYFVDILGFCIMGNHFHLLVQTYPEDEMPDQEVMRRFEIYYKNDDRVLTHDQIPHFRQKWTNLSEFIKELKQRFTWYYNKTYGRKGYFWSDRFKSVIVEKGYTLINCLAYIDLNPIRAGIVKKPEDYRWSSLGYFARTGNRDNLLTLDFGLKEYNVENEAERFRMYREYVYEHGCIENTKGAAIDEKVVRQERKKKFKFTAADRLRYRTRYFTEGVFLGSSQFVKEHFQRFKEKLNVQKERTPHIISGFENIYSFRQTP
jgi:REP element-mobilizing transposase RayT